MNILILIARVIVGAVVGWLVGLFLTRVTISYDNYRLERQMKKQMKRTNYVLDPLLKLDRTQQ